MERPIRVLQVFFSLGLGGAETRTVGLYENIDRTKVQFDFLTHQKNLDKKNLYYADTISGLGGRIYEIPGFVGSNFFEYKRAVKELFSAHAGEWAFVHGHMTSTASIYLPIAKKYGSLADKELMTIAHSRTAGKKPGLNGLVTGYLENRLISKRLTDFSFACSPEAGIGVFGKAASDKGLVRIVPNAIPLADYFFNETVRAKLRKEWGAENRFVIGHVGRFDFPKNHTYLIRVFSALLRRGMKSSPLLVMAGDGVLMEDIKRLVKGEGIEDNVLFLGNRKDISDIYQGFDMLTFPSFYEGLPGVVVEAQASGLPCLISDKITPMVAVTELVRRKSIDISPEDWADDIEDLINSAQNSDEDKGSGFSLKEPRSLRSELASKDLADSGFDAAAQAKLWEDFYLSKGNTSLGVQTG